MMIHKRVVFTILVFITLAVSFLLTLPGPSAPAKPDIAGAASHIYYVATDGSDSFDGSAATPFRTFAKAISIMQPGDELQIAAGVYTERLNINKSGTNGSPIHVTNIPGHNVVIDLGNVSDKGILVPAGVSYVNVNNIEVRNSNGYCTSFSGQYMIIAGLKIHDCTDMGLYVDGQHVTLDTNTVYRASLSNSPRTASSGWGSGIKLRVGSDDVVIQNNIVYHNYGEGIAATRSKNVTIRGNRVYDNYAVQIYVDNSINTAVERNHITCSGTSGYEYLNGENPNGIAIGEESYSGWGAQLSGVFIRANIVHGCKTGVTRFTSDVAGGGLDNAQIVFNTLYAITKTAIGIEYDAGNSGILIRNNITSFAGAGKHCYIENNAGITISNNFWIGTNATSNCRGSGDLVGDPIFVAAPNPAYTNTFKLAASSPAIAAGVAVTGATQDFAYVNRGNPPDMGAWEFTGTPVTSAPPPPTSSVAATSAATSVATTSVQATTSVATAASSANTTGSAATTTQVAVAETITSSSATTSAPPAPSQIIAERLLSTSGEVAGINTGCNADYNNDGNVDIQDFGIFAMNYTQPQISCSLDLREANCQLNLEDFEIFARAYSGEKVCRQGV